jgi:hypothetical protein
VKRVDAVATVAEANRKRPPRPRPARFADTE